MVGGPFLNYYESLILSFIFSPHHSGSQNAVQVARSFIHITYVLYDIDLFPFPKL